MKNTLLVLLFGMMAILPCRAAEPTRDADDELFERAWKFSNGWVATFKRDGRMMVEENGGPRTWHWWTIGHRELHVQYAADPATYVADIGGTFKFNSSYTKCEQTPANGKGNPRPNVVVALREKLKDPDPKVGTVAPK